MIIAICGVDGSGKSTLVAKLTETLSQRGIKAKRVYIGEYLLLLPVVKVLHLLHKLVVRQKKNRRAPTKNPFLGVKNRPLILKLWPVLTLLDNWLTYARLLFYSRSGYVVVCDRYFYDKLIGFEYHGYSSQLLSRLYLKLTPAPDLTFVLDVDDHLSRERETAGNHSLQFYSKIRGKYQSLRTMVPSYYIYVGNSDQQQVLEKLMKIIDAEHMYAKN